MSSEGRYGPPWGWRLVQQMNVTRGLRGLEGRAEFPNPGGEAICYFRGQFYWHKPLTNGKGEVVGHSPDWSLVPEEYALKLKQAQLAPKEV